MTQNLVTRRISLAEKIKIPSGKPAARFGSRHVQVLLMTCGFLCCYACRIVMSVALVAMTDPKSDKAFDWDKPTQSIILSSFFFGYLVTQIPVGMISQRWGAHKIFGFVVGSSAMLTLVIPVAAKFGGWKAICVCRVLAGLCQGGVVPLLQTLLAKWAPAPERATLTSFVFAGGWIGNVVALQSSGFIAVSNFHWPGCFYFWGSLGVFWAVLWVIFGKESPGDHMTIPTDEKEYIEMTLGVTETTEPVSIPWKSIFNSLPVWSLWLTLSCHSWGAAMLQTNIPSYMNSVLNFDIEKTGNLSSLPYLAAWIFSFPASYLADCMAKSRLVGPKMTRMFCNTFGQVVPAALLIGLGFVTAEKRWWAVVVLILTVTTNVTVFCSQNVNFIELSPNFAGTLMGIGNTAAQIFSALAPLALGALVHDQHDPTQWRNIFILSAVFYVIGSIGFLAFGSIKIQPWNDPINHEITKKPKLQDDTKNSNSR